jgi:uncharacterized protein (TIGR00297 family)
VEDVFVNILGTLALLGISLAAYRLRATDFWGTASGFALGLLIAVTSGWAWVAVLIAFLVIGSGATKYRYQFKLSIHAAEDKRGARGIRNVVANGAVAAAISVINYFEPNPLLAVLFVAAMSSAAADTLATEIGLLSGQQPVLINRPSTFTPPGISGGVTTLGEVAGLLGSFLMAIVAVALGVLGRSPTYVVVAALAGFVGCNVDSLLGSTIQVLYKCAVCGTMTERKVHCEQPTTWVKGLRAVGNNEVNLLSDVVAVAIAFLAFHA